MRFLLRVLLQLQLLLLLLRRCCAVPLPCALPELDAVVLIDDLDFANLPPGAEGSFVLVEFGDETFEQLRRFQLETLPDRVFREISHLLQRLLSFMDESRHTLYTAITEPFSPKKKKKPGQVYVLQPIGNFSFSFGFSFNFQASYAHGRSLLSPPGWEFR